MEYTEYVTVNGVEYATKSVSTGVSQIVIVMEGQSISDIETEFRNATELTVSGEDKVVYGTYNNLEFVSAMVSADDSITVIMHIPSKEELRLAALEAAVADHDAAIAEIYGGETV